jgi:glyoxylase-like metal-dependent hydrolase (beta-lactamase superfamily II)
MAYSVESDGQTLLIWGDTTNHFAFSLQQPDWHLAIDDDPEQAAATRKRILDKVATDRILAVGHHMPFPAVGYVEHHGNGYRWHPAVYQLWA